MGHFIKSNKLFNAFLDRLTFQDKYDTFALDTEEGIESHLGDSLLPCLHSSDGKNNSKG